MPANRRQPSAQSPAAAASQTTAKYINKDGSKFITVPKINSSADSSQTSLIMPPTQTKANGQVPQPSQDEIRTTTGVNRKKQKRREKARQAEEAARSAAASSRTPNSTIDNKNIDQLSQAGLYESNNGQYNPGEGSRPEDSDDDSLYANSGSPPNGYASPHLDDSLKPSKKKGKNKASALITRPLGEVAVSRKKIWNTSGPEERESIKEFWLSLGEEERRSLVKVEKDAVLRKMKEQQKHSCSCSICGRKRVAIEEELEVLYDAYYEELEQYANHQHGSRPKRLTAPRRFGSMNNLHPPHQLPPAFSGRQPSRARIIENFDDDDCDEEYSEDDADEDDYLSDESPIEELPRSSYANDFFNFGQSLTVKGGILTVADDLLKNDGKKFIEMMEQLAERRMAREEDAKEYSNSLYGHPSSNRPLSPHHHNHNHGPPQEDEDYDDDDDGEDSYDSQEDEYDEEEMATMTEEQRMEEGRRMFQIFAARMFEQRVLTAWKEKMAVERRKALLDEELNEKLAEEQKKAKKQEVAAKKKEKAQQKKASLAEEKKRKDEVKAAEEAKSQEAEAKKAEQLRVKAEERRKKRDAQKKAEEEERVKKEVEKQRRLQEQKDRQAEQERKVREAKERERKEKEEQRQKEKDAKDAKDKEARERRERQEKEKREAEAKIKAERELPKREEHTVHQLAAIPQTTLPAKRPQQPVSMPISVAQAAPSLLPAQVPVATPVIAKAPTPNRSVPTSHKDATSVPQTPQVGNTISTPPNSSTPLKLSPDPSGSGARAQSQPFLHQPQATSPLHSALKGPQGIFPPAPFGGMQHMGMNFAPSLPIVPPGFGGRMHHENMFQHPVPVGNQFRPLSNGIPIPPGMNGLPMQQGRGFPLPHAPPGFVQPLPLGNGVMTSMNQAFSANIEEAPIQSHSRQQSASYDKTTFENLGQATQPIARPPPIGRPSSVNQSSRGSENEMRELSKRLGGVELQGSASLLDDSDELLNSIISNPGTGGRRASGAPGMGRPYQQMPQVPHAIDHYGFNNAPSGFNTWGAPQHFPQSSLPPPSHMGGWGAQPQSTFGAVGGTPGRPSQPRNAAVRQMLCDASKALAPTSPGGWITINAVQKEIEKLMGHRDESISTDELIILCDTEGNQMNGGGSFDVRVSDNGTLIRFMPDPQSSNHGPVGAPGDIGSPVSGHGPMRFGGGLGIGGF